MASVVAPDSSFDSSGISFDNLDVEGSCLERKSATTWLAGLFRPPALCITTSPPAPSAEQSRHIDLRLPCRRPDAFSNDFPLGSDARIPTRAAGNGERERLIGSSGGIGASRDWKKAVIGWRMRGQVLFDP
ncbi:hypothetical protein BJ912DRAFT_1056598 [Pholiota molesta]|nr:hypothetical protein BJ912DRAFT_1056598 [Pholiota molesta]